ncbi:sulfatase-like hydrolase/transferase [Rhodospirillaceae bacterium KN72]|uniref:Sulfatase-like hydrolase/transferase n=1 Tax=Pacificispira spongiicola TaxID=2729598 RepID=A0A7Y0E3N3_9PROT|nr:LTA synthase family protein [Pacificispira spongiicola]NMM46650.1 sulfatase-like hydrolase/transferase [Pacificispira spongiicola]
MVPRTFKNCSRGLGRLLWLALAFLGISLLTRIGLALFSGESYSVGSWLRFLAVGMLFDAAVLPWLLLPWAVYDAIVPEKIDRPFLKCAETIWAGIWAIAYFSFFSVVAFGEFAFWGEFSSRFDFIAVDYLVYTHEVIGNIQESYPVGLWSGAIVLFSAGVWALTWPRDMAPPVAGWKLRFLRIPVLGLAAFAGVSGLTMDTALRTENAYVGQLSLNGLYSLFHAYRHNELDYERYYPILPAERLNDRIRSLVAQPGTSFISSSGIDRNVTARADAGRRDVNVVLISVESLSGDYLGMFGNTQNLTPELDKLANDGLLFTNLYATGTRTVRGLEALSIGTPPTPGQSIVRRPQNGGLENVGEELKEQGWTPYWVYGGYGYFDNMNAYFCANEYKVVDRTDLDAEGIAAHSENIWGVADEDLYSLAMRQFDREFESGNRFFAHIMTTSNHRPYTFPEGRVNFPQHHREGGVAYTDWAIGNFIRRASEKPWFKNTLFIITADHTAKAAGKTDLPPSRYHIPMIWYAPGLIGPGVEGRLMSQVDIAPTLMGWLGLDYTSRFFGYDLFRLEPGRERAFISTYQKLGYLKGGRLVILDVNKPPVVVDGFDAETETAGTEGTAAIAGDDALIEEAIAWYQSASSLFREGLLKDIADDGDEEQKAPACR